MFWNPQDLLYMMATEIIEIDAPWAEKWTKTRVSFLSAPTVWREFFFAASSILLEIGSIPLKYNQEKTDEAKPKLMFSAIGFESTDQAAAVVNAKAS